MHSVALWVARTVENPGIMNRLHGVLVGLCLAVPAAEAAVARPVQAFEAMVVGVSDGDTLTVMDSTSSSTRSASPVSTPPRRVSRSFFER